MLKKFQSLKNINLPLNSIIFSNFYICALCYFQEIRNLQKAQNSTAIQEQYNSKTFPSIYSINFTITSFLEEKRVFCKLHYTGAMWSVQLGSSIVYPAEKGLMHLDINWLSIFWIINWFKISIFYCKFKISLPSAKNIVFHQNWHIHAVLYIWIG